MTSADQLHKIRHIALDLDGTLYLGRRLFDFSLNFLQLLKQLGIGRTFLTNNSSRSTAQHLEHLQALGIDATARELFTSTNCTIDYLRDELPQANRLFVLGTPALRSEFGESGFTVTEQDEPDAVIAGFDTTLSYDRVCTGAYWISRGKPFIATHPDRICPTDQPTLLVDCGAICAMLTSATGRTPVAVLGKPHRRMLDGVMRRADVKASRLLMVGDRLYTDIAMARAADAYGALVLTGETTREMVADAFPSPDIVVEDLSELGKLLVARSTPA